MGVALVAMTSVTADKDDNFNTVKEVTITGVINVTDEIIGNYSMADVMNASHEHSHRGILNVLMLAKPVSKFFSVSISKNMYM